MRAGEEAGQRLEFSCSVGSVCSHRELWSMNDSSELSHRETQCGFLDTPINQALVLGHSGGRAYSPRHLCVRQLFTEANFQEKGSALSCWLPTLTKPGGQVDWLVKAIWAPTAFTTPTKAPAWHLGCQRSALTSCCGSSHSLLPLL